MSWRMALIWGTVIVAVLLGVLAATYLLIQNFVLGWDVRFRRRTLIPEPVRTLMYRIVALLLLVTTSAFAQDRPTVGLAYNMSEMSSIQYQCSMEGAATLKCDMTQSAVRKKTFGRNLRQEVGAAVAALKSQKPPKPEDCSQFADLAKAIRNPSAAPANADKKRFEALSSVEKDDLLRMSDTRVVFCQNHNADTAGRLAAVTFDRDSRSCVVSSHNFSMRFRRVQQSNTWTSNDGPDGPCGAITVASMEQDPKYPTFWNYVQKRVVTNPSANWMGNAQCSAMDQSEVRYNWQTRESYGHCDYIEFAP